MNILVVSQYYYPEPFRINEICEELVLYLQPIQITQMVRYMTDMIMSIIRRRLTELLYIVVNVVRDIRVRSI